MSLLKKNIVANLFGSAWLSLMGFIFIPLYIKFLGVAAWGLIGIFSTLQIVFGLLDMGLSSTLNREMARLSGVINSGQVMRNLLRTLEVVYWGMAIFVGVAIVLLSPLISTYWINSKELSENIIKQSLLLIGVIVALQLPIGLYSGGLMGLQKQVLLNSINILISTLRGVGVILILWLFSPTIYAFFVWQIFTSILNTVLLIFYLWKNLPTSEQKAGFEKNLFKDIWKFATGMSGISILSIILTQFDKIVLSKLISLEEFGYYMLANAVAMTIGRLVSPIFYSIYPSFTQLVARGNIVELKRLYHKVSQLVAVLIFPIAIVLVFFSYEVLLLWTKNVMLAQRSCIIVSILICGSAINAIMNPPFALQLAYGWTKLSLFKNIIAVIIIVPVIIFLATHYGPIGAAIAWLLLNIGYFIFEISIMHFRLLTQEKLKWYVQDVFLPLIACVIVTGLARLLLVSKAQSQLTTLFHLIAIYFASLSCAVMVTPVTRVFIVGHFLKFKKKLD